MKNECQVSGLTMAEIWKTLNKINEKLVGDPENDPDNCFDNTLSITFYYNFGEFDASVNYLGESIWDTFDGPSFYDDEPEEEKMYRDLETFLLMMIKERNLRIVENIIMLTQFFY